MGMPAAKQGDQVLATDTHVVQVGTSTTPTPHPFSGYIDGALSANVKIEGRAAATVGSTVTNVPSHVPVPPAGTFVNPPTNRGRIATGSQTVVINGKQAARAGDQAITCNDPAPLQVGAVKATSTVSIGG